jgi:hypothetical protein
MGQLIGNIKEICFHVNTENTRFLKKAIIVSFNIIVFHGIKMALNGNLSIMRPIACP